MDKQNPPQPDTESSANAQPEAVGEWYVIHTYSGYENKVKRNLELRIQTMDMVNKIHEVIIPEEEEIEVKDGQRRTVKRKVYPGYVMVHMMLDDDSWNVVRYTPGVTGFVGDGSRPIPLEEAEVRNIRKMKTEQQPRIKIGFQKGQSVRIIDGPFTEFVGTVDDINHEKGKVRVLVSFFGRETPVELDFLQVEKL
ncbi:MAG: transcription termination/antitermination protein NusG [Dehalococcoidia bacterium]|nr:transcription termination/antitermination protein NusG [Dehalococcoidia bacterium]